MKVVGNEAKVKAEDRKRRTAHCSPCTRCVESVQKEHTSKCIEISAQLNAPATFTPVNILPSTQSPELYIYR
jgi:hypothetical protein